MARVLCVDDDPGVLAMLRRSLADARHEVLTARNVPEALLALEELDIDAIVTDYQLPGIDGLEFIETLKRDGIRTPVIMITGHGGVDHAIRAIRAGAADYLSKPFTPAELALRVEKLLAGEAGRRELEELRQEREAHSTERRILGRSAAMRRVLDAIAAAARVRSTVLIQGESGTGKELVARALHEQSDRRSRPFIRLNCAALPAGLIESALFGHEKGAFTGAIKRVEGAFERANEGTLLLDEISEMQVDLQAKLLRVLQEREFERVGGASPIKVDVRVIATTNRNLIDEVQRGSFRRDLYYRLNVLTIHVPALRERLVEIPILAQHFVISAAAESHKRIDAITEAALELLQRYEWPGNVRELQHAVERAVVLARGTVLDAGDFELHPKPRVPRPGSTEEVGGTPAGLITLGSLNLDSAEEALINEALRRTGDNRTQAAALLGIDVRSLRKKLNRPNGPGQKGRAGESA